MLGRTLSRLIHPDVTHTPASAQDDWDDDKADDDFSRQLRQELEKNKA